MRNLNKLILLAAVTAVAVLVGLRFWQSDERAIGKQVAKIEALASKAREEKTLDSLLRARQLAAHFTDPCVLQVEAADISGDYSRKQLQDRIAMTRGFYTEAAVSVRDLDITLVDDTHATVLGTLLVKGEGNSQPVADLQGVEAEMDKIEGDWLVRKLTLMEVVGR
nr:hypothetical protein [uncultured Desulfobulbus sp.]